MQKTSLYGAASAGVLLALALGASAQAQDTTVAWKGAPQFQNDTLTFKVRGRVYMDVVSQEVDRDTGADFSSQVSRVRTARLGVEGTWNQNWAYKAEMSVTGAASGGNTATVAWEDLILEYKPNDVTSLMVGNFKTLSFENVSSSRYTTFMERGPFNDVIDAGRVMHAAVKLNGETWTATAAVSGDSINNPDPTVTGTAGGSEQVALNGRVTWVPVNGDTTKLHVGAWARKRDRGDSGAFTYQARNNTNYGARYISSGALGDADTMIGLEGLFIAGPFSVQAEYADIDIDRTTGTSGSANAYYAAVSWFPTGEMRNLDVKKGELGRTKILNPVTAGGFGAVELALRYDAVDLTDSVAAATTTSGEYSAWTAGANWYPFPYVRFMLNYTKAKNDNPVVVGATDVDVDTLQARFQFDF